MNAMNSLLCSKPKASNFFIEVIHHSDYERDFSKSGYNS